MEARVDGVRLVWDESGTRGIGPTLLLVHGFPLSRAMWEAQLADLADVAHVIAPDLRGHGDSDAPPGPYTMDAFAADLRALLAHLEIDRVVYCGHSMGATSASR
jgi:3-oxoadipate enol-lactonase